MKHVVIGTAGHIDHGKTTLIKAITGRDTDTLKEEKKRGISINLGFTYFDLPSGRRAGIIDVPGHEKFIKNMLAGVSSIDIVLLVVACDEGPMPQTIEHLEILDLLNIKKGIVVLTKKDLVDEEWISMLKEDIKEKLTGTFLEGSPMITVSSKSREGLGELIKEIDKATAEVDGKDRGGYFRLPVDRVFTISGFGTVVTGTIISGRIRVGDNIEVFPLEIEGKVRNIQVHEQNTDFAEAGQRCALNLSNIKNEELKRGNIISSPKSMEPSFIVDCKLKYLKSALKNLKNRQRIRVYHGTNELFGRVILLDKEELKPGEKGYIQLRLEKPLTSQRKDRIVIRSYSPVITIGGGVIIEPVSKKAKRFDESYLEQLKIKESGSLDSIVEKIIETLSESFPDVNDIKKALGRNEDFIEKILEQLSKEKRVIKLSSLDKSLYIHSRFLVNISDKIYIILNNFHKLNPLKIGMNKQELRSKIFGNKIKSKTFDEFLSLLVARDEIKLSGNFIALSNFFIKLTKDQNRIKEKLIDAFEKGGLQPRKFEELISEEKDKKSCGMVLNMLLDSGELIKLSEECIFSEAVYKNAQYVIIEKIKSQGFITTGEARDMWDTSRKFAVVLLEHFDTIKLTKRVDDKRVLN
ncbi:selenocysteine-specific translation factor [Clostridium polyendosporum]|uniref:Selenocysteine-specific elongation factor n=1 Tax=Clostridium polyendosporum TaxID=69208 RepID=A0A919S273_9CLOT|nr:selenocysteine-specific translation elongation factor [Clostridium polyendosporum]GIM29228.1 selenocysteine-specific translation factor [Clostridium polyendosporum]